MAQGWVAKPPNEVLGKRLNVIFLGNLAEHFQALLGQFGVFG
ncbi:hypothetical protein GCM10007338_19240 [Corynebacterium pelargi]|nr:hypothetical protein GCM10007338_19240 [Corynebacterium pelargi]